MKETAGFSLLSPFVYCISCIPHAMATLHVSKRPRIGVRAGGARGAAAPPNFGQLRFFGQLEKIWAKPVFKDVSMFFISLKRQIFSTLI